MKQILFAQRPEGAPDAQTFEMRETDKPEPGEGQILLRLVYLSVDPYLRGRMSEGKSYVAGLTLGAPMESGCVAEVEASNHPDYRPGDVVMGIMPWAEHALGEGKGLLKIDPARAPISTALGVLGMPGLTAWMGLKIHGEPAEGQTLVVSAATGAVGSLVAQLGGIYGMRVVGVAGGREKCDYAVETLGCDSCVDHRDPDLKAKLKAACPDGIDVYYENVGGATLWAVLPLLNPFARIPICGMISWYNLTGAPEGADRSPQLWRTMLINRVKAKGFIVSDHWDRYPEFAEEVGGYIKSRRVTWRETVAEGLTAAPRAFMDVLEGRNFGKQIVRVGPEPGGG